MGRERGKVQVQVYLYFTLFKEKLINIVYRNAEIKKYKQKLARKKKKFNRVQ